MKSLSVAGAALAAVLVASCGPLTEAAPASPDYPVARAKIVRGMTDMERDLAKTWIDAATGEGKPDACEVTCLSQGWGSMQRGMSVNESGTPLCLGGKTYEAGFGTHADSDIRVRTAQPAKRLRVRVGVDDNAKTCQPDAAAVGFSVRAKEKEIWSCPPRRAADGALEVDVDLGGAQEIHLIARTADGRIRYAHADWVEPVITLADGSAVEIARRKPGIGVGAMPPFSFRYAGRSSREFPAQWPVTRVVETLPDGVRIHRSVYKDPDTKLECTFELRRFPDFPAAQWVVRFRNAGPADTPILEDIQALDSTWRSSPATVLSYAKGSKAKIDDFLPATAPVPRKGLSDEPSIEFVSDLGRSSSSTLPFFNLHDAHSGVILGIGWTGQWSASFEPDLNGDVRVRAGLEKTRLVLHPGEEIRTPSILALFWQGDEMRGHNLLRRFLLRYVVPHENGRVIEMPLALGAWGGSLTADMLKQIRGVEAAKPPFDVYWIDAGWFGDAGGKFATLESMHWYKMAGNWNIDTSIHPAALRDVSEAARKAGMAMLLWVEPERAVWGTKLTQEHPDWFLGEHKAGNSVLLNLGNPDARKWATDYVSGLVEDLHLSWYRQDFNMPCLKEWRANDAPDRQGMTEIRHVEGLYAFWDELLRRHPGLKIDDCASGGRRIDLEMLSRSVPLWRSDYQCFPPIDPIGGQMHTMGLSSWVPLFGTSAGAGPMDTYTFRSFLTPGMSWSYPADPDRKTAEWYGAMIEQYRRARPFFYGDYYPLTKVAVDSDAWAGYQMHRPDLDAGFVMMFRRAGSPYPSVTLKLRGLDSAGTYEIEDVDAGTKKLLAGKELTDGTTWTLDSPQQSRMIFYSKVR